MKEKIAFVCQRYGTEVLGGAELLCKQLAEKLSGIYDVTVYTTCALDYVTWGNHYSSGTEIINGVLVKRYRNVKRRSRIRLALINQLINHGKSLSDKEEEQWILEQGPVCPDLINAIVKDYEQYKAVLFMTSLYYPTVKGMMLNLDNAFLIPTVHDEPPINLRIYERVFNNAKGIFWNSFEEQAFANNRFPKTKDIPCALVGAGIDNPTGDLSSIPNELEGKRYYVYAGRIDEGKGCMEMIDYYQRYNRETENAPQLVLMGKQVIKIPKDPNIIYLGYVSNETKLAVMKNSIALLLFSRLESLSMVAIESMYMGRPIVVTGKSDVLKGHCIRSKAGLHFNNFQEFKEALDYLQIHKSEYKIMCENGIRYVEKNYKWDVIIEKYKGLIDLVCCH